MKHLRGSEYFPYPLYIKGKDGKERTWSDVRPSMVTHTLYLCSAINPSKCAHTHTQQWTHTHSSEYTPGAVIIYLHRYEEFICKNRHFQKSYFLLCYLVFIVLVSCVFSYFLTYNKNNPTAVWLRLIGMHNEETAFANKLFIYKYTHTLFNNFNKVY